MCVAQISDFCFYISKCDMFSFDICFSYVFVFVISFPCVVLLKLDYPANICPGGVLVYVDN